MNTRKARLVCLVAVVGGIVSGCTPDDTADRKVSAEQQRLIDERSWASLALAVQLDQVPLTKMTRIWTAQAEGAVWVCGEGTPNFVAKSTVPDPKGGAEFRLVTDENVWKKMCNSPPATGLTLSSSSSKKDSQNANASAVDYGDETKQMIWIEKAKDQIGGALIDPRFSNVYFSAKGGSPVVCGQVTGKNGFGGYAQWRRFIAAGDLFYSIEDDEDADFPGIWRKLC